MSKNENKSNNISEKSTSDFEPNSNQSNPSSNIPKEKICLFNGDDNLEKMLINYSCNDDEDKNLYFKDVIIKEEKEQSFLNKKTTISKKNTNVKKNDIKKKISNENKNNKEEKLENPENQKLCQKKSNEVKKTPRKLVRIKFRKKKNINSNENNMNINNKEIFNSENFYSENFNNFQNLNLGYLLEQNLDSSPGRTREISLEEGTETTQSITNNKIKGINYNINLSKNDVRMIDNIDIFK